MDALAKRIAEQIKQHLADAARFKKAKDAKKMRETAETALAMFESLGSRTKKYPAWLTKLPEMLKPFGIGPDALKEDKKKKCSYRALTEDEIKKLKHNGEDPEELKGGDSEDDLFKCKPSGKVVIGRKSWHEDDDGNLVPGEPEYEDTEININNVPWPKKGEKIKVHDEIRIEFRIGGLTMPVDDILEKLPLPPDKIHRKGEKRGKSILTQKADWFVYSAPDANKTRFDKAVTNLVERLHPQWKEIENACGEHRAQLSCIFYFDASHRPYIHFPPDVLSKLSDMGAHIDVDLYPMRSDEE